jgi:hypothetical protein
MSGYELPKDDEFHPDNLAKLPLDRLLAMRPKLAPSAPLAEALKANAQARNLIAAWRAKKQRTIQERPPYRAPVGYIRKD